MHTHAAPDAWTFLSLGGDSYPAYMHVEEARGYALLPTLRLQALPCDHQTRLPPWDRVTGMVEAFLGR